MNRIDSPLQTALGFLAVALTLALVSPGVRIAQAADQASQPPAAAVAADVSIDPLLVEQAKASAAPSKKAPSCETTPGEALKDDALLAHQLRDLVKRAAAQGANGPQSSDQGIVLNGRGYNYRPTPIQPSP